jgi:glycosyltransferase involved in cell wall biosynthesis
MRVAYLLESGEFFGGVKVMIMQAEALARRGHRVTIVCPRRPPDWHTFDGVTLEHAEFGDSRALREADVRVATFFRTVRPALEGALGPVFHLCQGYEGGISFYRSQWPEIEKIYRLPTRKLTISRVLAERLESRGFGPVIEVGQALDREAFRPGPPRPASDPPVVFVIGALEIDLKGVDVALRGLDIYRRGGGRFRLVRASYFPPSDAERHMGLTDEFHHMIPPERMPHAYRAADASINAARPEEGFGLPALESLACGLPTLLSDTPAHREIAGDAAWYFPDGDAEALAARLPEILADDARARARVAGPAAAARYDTDRVAERLEAAFRQALGEVPVGAAAAGATS